MSSTASDPQPVVDGRGATILGPRNVPIERQNPDVLISPVTDAGTIPNLKWPFAMSRNRVLTGGFARETTARELPISTEIAGVDMRLTPGGIRELHWHPNADEWQYWLKGKGRMTVFASGGKSRTFDYQAGDVGVAPRAMGHYVENTGDETARVPRAVPLRPLRGRRTQPVDGRPPTRAGQGPPEPR